MRSLIAGLRDAWDRFWFAPGSALNLAAARVLLASHALWVLLSRDLPALSGLPRPFWAEVTAPARWRFLLFEGHPRLEGAVEAAAIAALVGAIAGLWPRACCLVAGLLLYHLAPLETLFFTPSPWPKGLTVAVLGLLTLGFSRCGDALVPRGSGGAAEAPSGEYGWPLRLVQLFLCQVYLFAGYAKLLKSGLHWASAENVRGWLLLSNLDDQTAAFRSAGLWIADRPALCLLMGVSALAFELGFAVVLLGRPWRRVLVPVAVVFHLAILVTLNYAFLYLPLLLLFVDWDAVGGRRRAQGTSSGSGGSPASTRPATGVTARLS